MNLLQWPTNALKRVRRVTTFGLGERIEWYENMAALRRGNVVTRDGLEIIAEVNAEIRRPRRAALYRQLLDQVRAGVPLPVAAADYVPNAELMVLVAGERSDTEEGFIGAARVARGSRQMVSVLAQATAYPLVLLCVGVWMLIGIADQLLPQFERMLKGKPMDGLENIAYIAMIRFISEHWPMVLGIFGAATALIIALVARWTGAGRKFADRYLPPFALYRLYSAASFVLAVAALAKTHMPLKDALQALHASASPYLRSHVSTMLATLVAGQGEAKAFDSGLLPPSIVIRIRALSRAGGITGALTSAGDDIVAYCVGAMRITGATLLGAVLVLIGVVIVWTLHFFNSMPLPTAFTQ